MNTTNVPFYATPIYILVPCADEASSSKDVNNVEPFESTADTENEPIPKNGLSLLRCIIISLQ